MESAARKQSAMGVPGRVAKQNATGDSRETKLPVEADVAPLRTVGLAWPRRESIVNRDACGMSTQNQRRGAGGRNPSLLTSKIVGCGYPAGPVEFRRKEEDAAISLRLGLSYFLRRP